jgi:hypothetical protein
MPVIRAGMNQVSFLGLSFNAQPQAPAFNGDRLEKCRCPRLGVERFVGIVGGIQL